MSEWRPIETAPKDGTPILAYEIEDGEKIVFISLWDGQWLYNDKYWTTNPSHWMPLPEPPQ